MFQKHFIIIVIVVINALIIDTIVIVIVRFNNFAFTDRGSQTPLPYVREVEVFEIPYFFIIMFAMIKSLDVGL